jgi:acetylornithine aminotransferase/acetylornithine/N-succinyldiaminopimelate aminotransferase
VLIEGIQGEGGITPARADYLLGLRRLCDERRLLLMMDGVQCGYFRSGRFQSFQRILEGVPGAEGFLPDAISMAKSLGGGFPIGAFWVREPYQDLLGPGSHATTFGGTPLACAVALRVLSVVERDCLADNARAVGEFLQTGLKALMTHHPQAIASVRGLGLMLGFELGSAIPAFAGSDKTPSQQMVNRLHEAGLLTVPSGSHVIRLLPALNLTREQAAEGLQIIAGVLEQLG